jgi:hypothetical protein
MFSFVHAMEHRSVLGVIGFQPGFTPQTGSTAKAIPPRPPLSQYSVIPYFVDPIAGGIPAGKYHLNHQQAHNDALRNVPNRYFWQYTTTSVPQPPPNPPLTFQTPQMVEYGLRVGANLIDFNLNNKRQRTWWTFQNHMEHYAMASTTVPAPAPKPAPQAFFPFW